MTRASNVSEMSLSEYCDYVEQCALYLGVDAHDLNRENFFVRVEITFGTYERAKWELYERSRQVAVGDSDYNYYTA
jgi:hypothetical protein